MTTNATDKPKAKAKAKDDETTAPDIKGKVSNILDQLPADVLEKFYQNSQHIINESKAKAIVDDAKAKLADLGYEANIEYYQAGQRPQRGPGRPRKVRADDDTPAKQRKAKSPTRSGRGRPGRTDADEKYDGARVAKMLKSYKRDNGLTISALADKCGVSQPAIIKWLNGSSVPTGDNLARAAKLVGA